MFRSYTRVGIVIEVFIGRSKRSAACVGRNQCFDDSMVNANEEGYT